MPPLAIFLSTQFFVFIMHVVILIESTTYLSHIKKPLYVLSVNFVLSLHDISYNAIKNKKSSKKIILMF